MTLDGDPIVQGYLEWLATAHPGKVSFVVLYGSRARGHARKKSDYDVLAGLCEDDELRFIDRLGEYNEWDYCRSEASREARSLSLSRRNRSMRGNLTSQ